MLHKKIRQTFAITTLGCKVNQFESAEMIEQFRSAGWEMVPFSEKADLYLVNSCTVTGRSDAESRKLLRRARRANPEAKVIATGCYAQVSPEELKALSEVDQVLGNQEKHDILRHISLGNDQVSNLTDRTETAKLKLKSFAEHTRAFLQIQTGCENGCSYCIVPIARGPNRSVPADEVCAAVQRLAAQGYREVVLTGIHLGAYQPDLAGLLQKLDSSASVERLRLGSIEPNELSDTLLELIASSPRICHHLHIPLQSGSDTVLQRMKRRYDSSFYHMLIEKAARCLPDCFLAADIIAGFPGETEAEFLETCELIASLPLADLHIFPYSRRPGTTAASMPGQVHPATIKERVSILQDLAKVKQKLFRQRFIGQELQVLGQRHDAVNGLVSGLSGNYLEVRFPCTEDAVNRLYRVRITGQQQNYLTGTLS